MALDPSASSVPLQQALVGKGPRQWLRKSFPSVRPEIERVFRPVLRGKNGYGKGLQGLGAGCPWGEIPGGARGDGAELSAASTLCRAVSSRHTGAVQGMSWALWVRGAPGQKNLILASTVHPSLERAHDGSRDRKSELAGSARGSSHGSIDCG